MARRAPTSKRLASQIGHLADRVIKTDARFLNLENWMRTTFVTVALVAVGVAAQLFYTLLRFGLQPPTP